MSLEDLERRLEQYEAHLRETRLLLAQQKHRRAGTPGETLDLAAGLLAAVTEADALAEQLSSRLQYESMKRTQVLRQRQYQAMGKDTTPPVPPNFGSEKLYGRGDDDDEAAGNAPVPALPRPPVPVLAGGAARRFEESDEPPRNP